MNAVSQKIEKPTTEQMAERIYEAMRRSTHRLTAADLASIAGCSQRKIYIVLGVLKGLMEATGDVTISNKRGIGYRIAGVVDGEMDEVQKQIDILMEATKSAERGFAHLRRQARLIPKIDRELLRDTDHIELLSINVGMQIAAAAVMHYEKQLKNVASEITRRMLSEAKEDTDAPSKEFGVKSFADMMRDARDDDDEDK